MATGAAPASGNFPSGMAPIGGFPAAAGNTPFGDNLLGAFQSFLTGRQGAIQANQETELKKAQVQEEKLKAQQAQQAQAKGQLVQYASGLTDQQKSDPAAIEQYKKLYQAAGMVGDPTEQGITGPRLNTDSVLKTPAASMTDEERQYILGLQKGPQRDAVLDSRYYNVDPALRDAPQVRTPQEQIANIGQATKALQMLGSGVGNPIQTSLTLQLLKSTFPDPQAMQEVITQLTDPTNANMFLGPIAAARAQQYTNLGLDEKAIANFKNAMVTELPKKWAAQLQVSKENADTAKTKADNAYTVDMEKLAIAATNAAAHQQEADAATSKAQSAAAEVTNHADSNKVALLRVAAGTLNSKVVSLGNAYRTAAAQANAILANPASGGIGDPDVKGTPANTMKAAHDSLVAAQQAQAHVSDVLSNAASNALHTMSGNQTKPANPVTYKPGQAVPGHTGWTFTGKTHQIGDKTVQEVKDSQGNLKGWTP